MESAPQPHTATVIMKVQLCVCPVVAITVTGHIHNVSFELPNRVVAVSHLTFKPKLKPGDFVTLYTEVERDAKEDN